MQTTYIDALLQIRHCKASYVNDLVDNIFLREIVWCWCTVQASLHFKNYIFLRRVWKQSYKIYFVFKMFRQFIETYGTENILCEENLFIFELVCYFCPGSQKINILTTRMNEYLTSREYICIRLHPNEGLAAGCKQGW
jgi:hypothetical protein